MSEGISIKRLSSRSTFFYKYIFPTIWITGFGIGALLFILRNNLWQNGEWSGWFIIFLWIAGSSIVMWFSLKIKKVSLVDKGFIVSNYKTEYYVGFRDVLNVEETRLWNPKLIKINLKRDFPFGDRIVFIAPYRLQLIFMNHPMVEELREIIRSNLH